jgi:hypothetical protein
LIYEVDISTPSVGGDWIAKVFAAQEKRIKTREVLM